MTGKELNISLTYSVKLLKEEDAKIALQNLKNGIDYNETTRILLSIRQGKLFVLNSLKSIISEVSRCLILGLNQAAITLTNNLFENTLKIVLIDWESKGKRYTDNKRIDETFSSEIERYDDNDLEVNINQCKNKGLITKEEAKRLKYLKDRYRNSFSHASFLKSFSDVVTPTIHRGNINKPFKLETEENVKVAHVPFLRFELQKQFAEVNAIYYFIEIYSYVDKLDRVLLELYPEIKELAIKEGRLK